MRKFSKKQYLAAGVAAAIITAGAGAAYAYWSTTGSGTGTATTSAGNNAAVHITNDDVTGLYPGQAAQPLTVRVTNTDAAQSVYVNGVTAYLSIDNSHATAGCSAADYKLNGVAGADASNPQIVAWTAQELTKGQEVDTSASIQFNDLNSPQDYCKGATVTVNYASN